MRRLRLSATRFVVLVFTVALTIWAFQSAYFKQAAQNPDYCFQCHEMKPQYNAWKATAHNRFGCTECHRNVKIATFRYKQLTGFIRPVKLKQIIPNAVCLECHNQNRKITPPGKLIIPHEFHLKKGIDCVDCHSNLAHGTRKTIPMSTCLKCHNGAKAARDCAVCHPVPSLPQALPPQA